MRDWFALVVAVGLKAKEKHTILRAGKYRAWGAVGIRVVRNH